jgi:hypothetical protein
MENAGHPFYRALGQLAQSTLANWQEYLPIAVTEAHQGSYEDDALAGMKLGVIALL